MLSKLTIRPHCAYGSVFTGRLRFRLCHQSYGGAGGDLLPGVWGCPACNAPLRGHSRTMQRDAAGVRGVPEAPFSFPQQWETKGVDHR